LLKNSICDSVLKDRDLRSVLKGRGFQPRHKPTKSIAALAAEVICAPQSEFFNNLFSRRAEVFLFCGPSAE